MCGIAGFTGKQSDKILEACADCIAHRGPDQKVTYSHKNFHIGYRRLAIIDLSEDIYPIYNEDKDISLVLNGEIYNYQALRIELENKGHVFKTNADSETIIHGYEEWGYDVVNRLRGMFVFVLVDQNTNKMFIARDRLGIKPFYYAKTKERILFGSEIKSILTASVQGDESFTIKRTPDKKSVYSFLASRIHDIDERTFFKNIKRLLPGHYMIVDTENNIQTEKYWNPTFNPRFSSTKSDEEYANDFKDVFKDAMRLHLVADVPVGVTLSGGLDSSGITSLAKQLYDEALTLDQLKTGKQNELIAFSAVHPGETIDESVWIDSVVEYTGIKSIKIQPNVDTFWEELEEWVYFQEEPTISGAPYAYYVVMREASKFVTVFLSGQGGDELLAGYIPYFLTYAQSAVDQKQYGSLLREIFKGRDLYVKYFLQKMMERMGRNDFINPYDTLSDESRKYIQSKFKPSRNLNERLFYDVTSMTTPSLLRYEDKNSMAHSLESRVPFFDHQVLEHIFNLPIDQKIKHGWTRFVYRNAMKGVIPEKNRTRRSKVGFTNPEWEWIERRAQTFRELFSSTSFKSRPFWDADKVMSEFELTLSKEKTGDILYFWRIFSVEMWMRVYVDEFTPRL